MRKSELIKKMIIFLFAQLSKKDKIELIDAIAAGAKLTKADAGRIKAVVYKPMLAKLKVVFGGKGQ